MEGSLVDGRSAVTAVPTTRERQVVDDLLAGSNLDAAVVGDGREVLSAVADHRPDIVVIGSELPDIEGEELCRRLRRRWASLPIIVVAAGDDVDQRVRMLDAGADEVVTATTPSAEVHARVRALLRRAGLALPDRIVVGDVRLDPMRRTVHRGSNAIELTPTEFSILELLMTNVDIVLARPTVYERIWGVDLDGSSKALDVHVTGLRRKLERFGPRAIHNVRAVGYVMWTTPPT